VLLFGLSSYGIYFGRRVLLDNVATFWMLLAIHLLLSGRLTLWRAATAAATLAVSVLSKEVVLALVPMAAVVLWWRVPGGRRLIVVPVAFAVFASVCSVYPLMAALKGELLPGPTRPDGTAEHVSLVEAVRWQATRDRDGGIVDSGSAFWFVVRYWLRWERFLIVAGTVAAAANVLLIRRAPSSGLLGLGTLSLWAFLGRGVATYEFYLVPLVPLLALSLGLATKAAGDLLATFLPPTLPAGRALVPPALAVACVLALSGGYRTRDLRFGPNPWCLWSGPLVGSLWSNRQADALSSAAGWVTKSIPPRSRMIIDISIWTELHSNRVASANFDNAHYYWRVARDPAIRDGVFNNDASSIDCFVTTPQLERDVAANEDCAWIAAALAASRSVARFDSGGWPIEVRVVDK
jgi:hypothetical protein